MAKPDDLGCGCPDQPLHEQKGCSATDPDWSMSCEVCDRSPAMPITGLCGICTWGVSEGMDWEAGN